MKLEDQILSIDQIENLRKLGLEIKEAAVCWIKTLKGEYIAAPIRLVMHDNYIPTLTFQEIIDILPDTIKVERNGKLRDAFLVINKAFETISYNDNSDDWKITDMYISFSYDNNILEAAYKALVWCINNKYL